MRNIKDFLLDTSIYYSFDQSGFLRHQKAFTELPQDLTGKHILITGANAGIGYETAKALAQKNATILMLCRNLPKSEQAYQALKAIQPLTQRYIVDMSDLSSINRLEIKLPDHQKIDCVIQNAGLMPQGYQESSQGLEICTATHLVGPMALLIRLSQQDRLSPKTSNIFVSSGGGYTKKLSVSAMFDLNQEAQEKYDGMQSYAHSKRAQMVLSRLINEKAYLGIKSEVMHPGWASTDGVKTAMPKFFEFTKNRLRTAKEGADTVIFLACQSIDQRERKEQGGIWFDRVLRKEYLIPGTQESEKEREAFWLKIKAVLGQSQIEL